MALFPAFRSALGDLASLTHREILAGQPLAKWRTERLADFPFSTELSARQMKSVNNMVYAAVSGWQELLVGRVRELIAGSELPEDRKTVLWRVNARKSWWDRKLDLPWQAGTDGELVPCTERWADENPERSVWLPVDDDDLKLARQLAKHAQKRVGYPNLSRVDTLILDSIIAKPSRAQTATRSGGVGWYVTINTLIRGKLIQVPLARNTYFEKHLQTGQLCGAVQLHLTRDRQVAVSLLVKTPDAQPRTVGQWLGIDFGIASALFATSQGQLLGQRFLHRLCELDAILTPYAADLQRRGIKLKNDPYYRRLQARITGYATNEIGRLLNRIAAQGGEHTVMGLVVEKLDFRGGGLSRRMNRIITRTGRKVLKTRLAALTAKHGIAVAEVPSPYTSAECSSCGYTTKNNRKGPRFRCGFCGLKLHADVNAARVILSRRSRLTPDHTGPRSRKITLRLLDSKHRERWNLPTEWSGPRRCRRPGPARQNRPGNAARTRRRAADCISLFSTSRSSRSLASIRLHRDGYRR